MAGLLLCGQSVFAQTSVTFEIPDTTVTLSEGQVGMPVRVSGFADVTTFQFTVTWDPAQLGFIEVNSLGLPDLGSSNFEDPSDPSIPPGVMTVSWNSDPTTVADNSIIFVIVFDVLQSGLSNVLFANSPTPQEVTINFVEVSFDGQDGSVNVVDTLPVELAAFQAAADGRDAVLRWQTLSETNNAGFSIEQRVDGAFVERGYVGGAGTTLEAQRYTYRVADLAPGMYVFRLKQIDFDGHFAYSPEVEVAIEMPDAYALSSAYPNPFNPQSAFTLSVQQPQTVRIALYDALGREVALLHDGALAEQTAHSFTIDGAGLSSGLYLIRVAGETFSATQPVTLRK